MKKYCDITFQMTDADMITEELKDDIMKTMGLTPHNFEEDEGLSAEIVFATEKTTDELCADLDGILARHPNVYYADMVYRFEWEFNSDRVAIWQGGRRCYYRGITTYMEEDDR